MSDTMANAVEYTRNSRLMENAFFSIISFLNDSKFYDEERNKLSEHPLLRKFVYVVKVCLVKCKNICMFVLLNKEMSTVRSKYVLISNLNLISVDLESF